MLITELVTLVEDVFDVVMDILSVVAEGVFVNASVVVVNIGDDFTIDPVIVMSDMVVVFIMVSGSTVVGETLIIKVVIMGVTGVEECVVNIGRDAVCEISYFLQFLKMVY